MISSIPPFIINPLPTSSPHSGCEDEVPGPVLAIFQAAEAHARVLAQRPAEAVRPRPAAAQGVPLPASIASILEGFDTVHFLLQETQAAQAELERRVSAAAREFPPPAVGLGEPGEYNELVQLGQRNLRALRPAVEASLLALQEEATRAAELRAVHLPPEAPQPAPPQHQQEDHAVQDQGGTGVGR
jgi:hypothetical protein